MQLQCCNHLNQEGKHGKQQTKNLLQLVDVVSNFIGEIFKETPIEVGKDIAKEKPAIKAAVKNNVRKPICQFLGMILSFGCLFYFFTTDILNYLKYTLLQ